MANGSSRTAMPGRGEPRLLSFVIPMYNEAPNVARVRATLEALAERLPCPVEWVLVDDGSSDATSELLQQWAAQNGRAKVVELSRNFGQQVALTAGIDQARGDALLLLDGDLQDPPELVLELLARFREGYDIVNARRIRRRGESIFKRASSVAFYWVMRRFVQRELPPGIGDFRLISGDVAEALRTMREGRRFMRGLMAWVGYRQCEVPFERQPRRGGCSKFNVWKLGALAKDAVLSFSDFPARMGAWLGAGVALASGLALVWPAPLGADRLRYLQLLIAGAILFCLGVIGEYVGRLYDESKHRPLYIVRRTFNLELRRVPRAVFPESPSTAVEASRSDAA